MEEKEIRRTWVLPGSLDKRLERIAKKERRSVSAQLIVLLEEAVVRYEQKEQGPDRSFAPAMKAL